ncbi:MAG TPA: ATP-binding protein [Abditibacterium sp.]|jgi:molecular chaperone HtpG
MTEPTRQPFKLHLPGLLKVLAEHLYSSKQVAVRELIQNAHDGCRRRQSEASESDYQPRIRLEVDPARRLLRVSDNGNGLTRQEIEDYLATIGRSYTRELRQNLSALSPDEAAKLIGQFGFGFLSAFLLADEVRVVTKSRTGDEAFEWVSDGGESYEIRDATREETGTTVELRVKSAASFVLREGQLLEIVRQYADFLPLPIYVGSEPEPANLQVPPWEAPDIQAATREYIERAFGVAPLAVIPLRDHQVALGHDTLSIPLQGFLFVPPGSVASVREYGDINVFIRKMFICRDDHQLLPPWARFIRGAIDCPHLQPTASREDLHQDDNFEATRAALEIQLAQGLQDIAQNDPDAWEKIVRGHTDLITGWAARDDAFFDAVSDIVTFRTSRGALTLPQYLSESGGDFYYTTRELGSLQERLLAEGHGVPVIDASWFGVQPFLAKYALRTRDCDLIRLDGEAQNLLRPVEDPQWEEALDFYTHRGVAARVCAFEPAEVPALIFYPEDAEFAIEGRKALDEGEIADPLAALLGDYLENRAPAADAVAGTLVLNASNELMQNLAKESESAARDSAFDLVLHLARLFSGRTLNASDAARAFAGVTSAVELMRSRH